MNDKRRIHISKFMSKYLRHSPEEIGLTLEPGGWVSVSDLIDGAARSGFRFTREELEVVVESCDKQRFAIDETGERIRANQGHSAEVDLQFEPATPPAELFHGTVERNLGAILQDGLLKMARHHVHLSANKETAIKVGQRRGKPVILIVDSARMLGDGHTFFVSANGVWLVDHVPPKYLRVFTTES
jgi:putative RNA 2'-phosphotransferase